MTLHLAPELEQRLEHLAAESHRSPDELAHEALDGYIKHIEALTAEVREGHDSAERDGWVTHEEVFHRLRNRLQKSA